MHFISASSKTTFMQSHHVFKAMESFHVIPKECDLNEIIYKLLIGHLVTAKQWPVKESNSEEGRFECITVVRYNSN